MNIIDTNLDFGSLSKRKSTTRIILHHTATSSETVEQIHDYHKNKKGWSGIGYHLYVRKDGSVYRGRPIDTVGAHATGANSDSVGVCFEGNFETETMPDVQKEAGKEAVAYVKQLYGISTVQRHKDVGSTSCPGKNFPFDEIVNGQATAPAQPAAPATGVNYRVRVNTPSGVNVRSGAGENFDKITAIPNGTEVTITQESNGWGYAAEKGGWICLKYTQRVGSGQAAAPAQTGGYTVGQTYTLQANMNVRTGAGINYPIKAHSQLTAGGQAADPDKNGSLQKGTRVTCQEIKQVGADIWMRIPSGWIAAVSGGKTYVS